MTAATSTEAPDGASGVVVALKSSALAKSRLDTFPDPLRRRLAWTMAVDTLTALAAATGLVVVVSRQPALRALLRRAGLDVDVRSEIGAGSLDAALHQGAEALTGAGYRTVVACVGDLPALRPEAVRAALDASRAHPRSFVADASGTGTTMLISHRSTREGGLDPHFGGRSAAAHRSSGAVALVGDDLRTARRDVDTEVDLLDALRLGVGRWTGALVDPSTGRLGTYTVITATDWRTDDGTPQAVTSSGLRVVLPGAALSDGLQHVRLGQRLHAVVADGAVLSAWL
jgi:2-phospho-L-lactate guanylyltransferase